MGENEKVLRYGEDEFTDRVDSREFGTKTRLLYDHLNGRVIGQERAARRIAQGFSIYNAGLKEPNEPIGVYLFAGPTGWGKTFMGEELARFLIEDVATPPLMRIPCGKYSERHRVSELIGSPPGYIDSDKLPGLAQVKIDEFHFWVKIRPILDRLKAQGKDVDYDAIAAQLYEQHQPYLSVLLFDEFEKAHPDLWNAMLHIVGDGELTFAHGGITKFHNSVVILTCNVGGREQQQLISGKGRMGFGSHESATADPEQRDQEIYKQTLDMIEQKFPPELVGRLKDNIIVFRTLNREQCRPVLENMLKKVQEKVTGSSTGIPLFLSYTQGFKDFLLDKGVNPTFGLRPLKGKVKKYVTLRLANAIESDQLRPGDEVMFKIENGKPVLFRKPRPILPAPRRRELILPPKPGNKG